MSVAEPDHWTREAIEGKIKINGQWKTPRGSPVGFSNSDFRSIRGLQNPLLFMGELLRNGPEEYATWRRRFGNIDFTQRPHNGILRLRKPSRVQLLPQRPEENAVRRTIGFGNLEGGESGPGSAPG